MEVQVVIEVEISRGIAITREEIRRLTAMLRAMVEDVQDRLPDQAGSNGPVIDLVGKRLI